MSACQQCHSLLVRFVRFVGWVCADCGYVDRSDPQWTARGNNR